MNTETWEDVPGYVGRYKASSMGRIMSNYWGKEWKIITGTIGKNGYLKTILSSKSIKSYQSVHRIVANSFIPNPENKGYINHKDGNKLNNCVYNLEWVTAQENMDHAIENNLKPSIAGTKNNHAKITEAVVHEIRSYKNSGKTMDELAKIFPVNRATINKIINKKLWSHI